jgi:hypothetical protein
LRILAGVTQNSNIALIFKYSQFSTKGWKKKWVFYRHFNGKSLIIYDLNLLKLEPLVTDSMDNINFLGLTLFWTLSIEFWFSWTRLNKTFNTRCIFFWGSLCKWFLKIRLIYIIRFDNWAFRCSNLLKTFPVLNFSEQQ